MLATCLAAPGCQGGGEPAPLCDWVEEEVPLDYSLGPWGGDLDYDLQPGKVLELLTVPLEGTLMWKGGGDWAEITPGEGETPFSSMLSYGGTAVYRRVPGAEGDLALACLATIDFDATIDLRTDDGVLDETWETTVSFGLATGNATADIDGEAVGLVERLQITPKPEPPVPFDDLSYATLLSYKVYPLSPELTTTTSGRFYMLGDFEAQQDGEIIDMGGVSRLLVEWVGMEEP